MATRRSRRVAADESPPDKVVANATDEEQSSDDEAPEEVSAATAIALAGRRRKAEHQARQAAPAPKRKRARASSSSSSSSSAKGAGGRTGSGSVAAGEDGGAAVGGDGDGLELPSDLLLRVKSGGLQRIEADILEAKEMEEQAAAEAAAASGGKRGGRVKAGDVPRSDNFRLVVLDDDEGGGGDLGQAGSKAHAAESAKNFLRDRMGSRKRDGNSCFPMRCSFYVGAAAAVAVAPGSLAVALAFHAPPGSASHDGTLAEADAARRAGAAVAAPACSASTGRWRRTGASCAGCFPPRRPRLRLAASSSSPSSSNSDSGNDGLGGGTERRNSGGLDAMRPSVQRLQNIPHTSLVLRDEATGCDIYLVGCLHGSHSSGRDVQDVLEEVRPGAVVLELCESRHKALRQELEKKAKGGAPLEGKERWVSVFRSWVKGVQKTSKKAGVLQGVLAGLLSAPYLVQRLGDFDPGLEFKTAMVYADASKLSSRPATAAAAAMAPGPGECAIVLGDRDVQETLRRLGGALTALTRRRDGVGEEGDTRDGSGGGGAGGGEGGGMMGAAAAGGVRELSLNAAAASDSYWSGLASDLRILQMATVGPSGREWPDSLNVFDTVWRERQALGTLVLPLLFGLTVITETVQRSIGGAASAVTGVAGFGSDGAAAGFGGVGACGGKGAGVLGGAGGSAEASLDMGRVLQGAGDVLDTLFVVWTVWYMLRFFRLVIKERDDVLAENVLKACRSHPGRPVVAVLGLLHCNGVADILRNSDGFRGAATAAGGE
eukprot:g10637.t2